MLSKLKVVLGVLLSFSIVSDVHAIGTAFIGNEVPSARAAGAGYVGVAGQNNDPTAVYTNPAAMTSLKGTQVTVGGHFENIRPSFENSAGVETKAKMSNVFVPNFSITQSFMDGKLAAGFGTQSQFGLETHWGGNSPMRYVATDSRLAVVDVTPAVAYQVHPMVSIGAGVDYYNVLNAQLDKHVNVDVVDTVYQSIGVGTGASGSGDAVSSLRGNGSNWGYHGGITVQPHEQHAIGLSYHSKVNLRVNGNLSISGISPTSTMGAVFGGSHYETSAYTDVVLPSNVQFGYAYKPTEKWILEADAAWYHWSENQDLRVRFAETSAARLALLNTGNPQPLTARDAWSFATGANYKVNDKVQVRTGFWYEPWALPESTFNPAYVDLSRYGLSFGGGYGITDNLTLDAAYTAVFFHNRTINNSVQVNSTYISDGAGGLGSNGTYSDFTNLLALNLTYRFGAGK